MHVVEMSLGEGGAMSHSGVQVEYVSAARVDSVWPSSGVVSGGTVVTLSGEGFVAGRTGCRFGSAEGTEAVVMSSREAQCVAPSAVAGLVGMYVSSVATEGVWHETGLQYKYVGVVSVQHVSPLFVNAQGGSAVTIETYALDESLAMADCVFGGSVTVAARSVSGGLVECMSVAGAAGNTTVELSLNGQDMSTGAFTVEYISLANVSMVTPSIVGGGSEVMVSGSGLVASGVRCAVGGSVLLRQYLRWAGCC